MKVYGDLDLRGKYLIENEVFTVKTNYLSGSNGGFWDTVNSINGGGNTIEQQSKSNGCFLAIRLRTGTAANGATQARQASGNFLPESGTEAILTTRCKIPTLSTLEEEFTVNIGMMNSTSVGGTITSGYFLKYDRQTSINWFAHDGSNSQNTGIAVSTNWFNLTFKINGTSCQFLYDGNLVATLNRTLTIPIHAKIEIIKKAGVTSREVLNSHATIILK